MDKLAEFVCGTIPMLYETKTQNMGGFTYFVSQTRGISKKAPIHCKCSLVRAAVGIRFQFPFPSHSHRKSCGNSHGIPIPTEPRNLPYLYPTHCVFSIDVYEMPSTLNVSFDAFRLLCFSSFLIFTTIVLLFVCQFFCVCIFCVTLFSLCAASCVINDDDDDDDSTVSLSQSVSTP